MSILNKLTEGLVNRDLKKEGEAVVSKWDKTGLLEGLSGNKRSTMARLLENQAKELLREASSMAAGDVEGFAAVAFPIVRRVFGGLVANDLVSVQPMSLPSGLIFFLDFTYTDDRAMDAGSSIYGGGVVASQLTGGVTTLTGSGFYNLTNAYSSPTGSLTAFGTNVPGDATPASATVTEFVTPNSATSYIFVNTGVKIADLNEAQKKAIRFDPDVLGQPAGRVYCGTALLSTTDFDKINLDALGAITMRADEGDDGILANMSLDSKNGSLLRVLGYNE